MQLSPHAVVPGACHHLKRRKDIMNFKQLFAAVPLALLVLGQQRGKGRPDHQRSGALVCVADKWGESEPDKGHKLVDFGGRCVLVPDDPAAPKSTEDCVGKYEYLPDGSWKGSGGDKVYESWEEGSHLKEYMCTFAGGTGKYQGARGMGTYTSENLTDTLSFGRYKGKLELP
jgi:hypothetical protein